MRRAFFVLVLTILAAPAWADEQPLSGAEMVAVLSGKTALGTDPASPYRQYFDPNGDTIYVPEGGEPDVGKWRVGGGQYCSQWGGRGWDCYDMTGDGDAITWIWPSTGQLYPARLVPGNALK